MFFRHKSKETQFLKPNIHMKNMTHVFVKQNLLKIYDTGKYSRQYFNYIFQVIKYYSFQLKKMLEDNINCLYIMT